MKYYIGTIDERNGDFEYRDKYLFATKGDPAKYAEKQTREWRSCTNKDWDKEHGGYWCDCTLVFNGGYREISEDDYNVLTNYLAVL
jgi:hypothetical protein